MGISLLSDTSLERPGMGTAGNYCVDQAARLQRPKANPAVRRFIGLSRWLGELQMGECLPCLYSSLVV